MQPHFPSGRLLPWAPSAPAVHLSPLRPALGLQRGVPLGASTLRTSALGPLSGASSCHLPGVPLSPLYHANFSRDNFSTMSPPARTETLYGAGPREAAALPRQTKAHCCCGTCLRLSGQFAERAASSPRRGSTWSAASWRLIKISITAPEQGGRAARKVPEAGMCR